MTDTLTPRRVAEFLYKKMYSDTAFRPHPFVENCVLAVADLWPQLTAPQFVLRPTYTVPETSTIQTPLDVGLHLTSYVLLEYDDGTQWWQKVCDWDAYDTNNCIAWRVLRGPVIERVAAPETTISEWRASDRPDSDAVVYEHGERKRLSWKRGLTRDERARFWNTDGVVAYIAIPHAVPVTP
jgi:hypothetical protein